MKKAISHQPSALSTRACFLVTVMALVFALALGAGVPTAEAQAAKAATAPAAQKAAPAQRPAPGRVMRDPAQLKYPPLGDVKLPDIKRYTLSNGIRLFIVEDHRLPLVDGFAIVRTGDRWEPADKVGLAGITGSVMRTGGTKTRTGDQLDEELESIAASVESSVGDASGSAAFSALKADTDRVLGIFADVLMNPEFRQDKIELAKTMARTGISRRNEDPGSISRREFRKLIYGKESPYARHAEYATLDNIQRVDLLAFHRRYYHPNNIMIGVVGDVNAEEMRQKVEKAFAAWKPSPDLKLPPVPEAPPAGAPRVNFIRKEDVNQATVRIGHLGGLMKDPDYFALEVMSNILGEGGFSSRLMKKIRSQMGLAYQAGGSWSAGYDAPGVFGIVIGTKSESTVDAIQAAMTEVQAMREKEVTDEELRVAKEQLLNSFVFNFSDPGQILRRLMTFIYYGYPEDFLEQYKRNVEKVTKADVLRVAQKHLHPDRMTLLVVGNEKEFGKPLTSLAMAQGKVNEVDITIPEAKAAATPAGPASPAAAERGRAVFAAAQKAAGGAERLQGVKDISTRMQMKIFTPQGEMEAGAQETLVMPSTLRSEQVLPFGTMVTYFDGAGGWQSAPQGTRDLPDAGVKTLKAQLARNTFLVLAGQGDYTVQFEKREKVGDADADVIAVTRGGETVRLFVDATSGKVLKKAYRGQTPFTGPADMEDVYSDYREVSGLQMPFQVTVNANGQKFVEAQVTEIKVNSGPAPADLAKKPAP